MTQRKHPPTHCPPLLTLSAWSSLTGRGKYALGRLALHQVVRRQGGLLPEQTGQRPLHAGTRAQTQR